MNIAILHAGTSGFFPSYYKALKDVIETDGGIVKLFVPNSGRNSRNKLPNQIMWGSRLNWFAHNFFHKLTGVQDVFSVIETILLIRKLEKFQPDLLHFNIINDKIINLPLLVYYVNKNNIPVVWTMHDCRAFTGQCTYFDEAHCNKWKDGCRQCPKCETLFDNTKITWNIRRKYHAHIKRLTIVTPSQWLASLVKDSFFKEIPIRVIYNGVDLDGFSKKTDFDVRRHYNIPANKRIILGCAINWDKRKGVTYFEELSKILPPEYQIVLIGNICKEEKERLTRTNILCIGKTKTFTELVAWYQSSDVFCNTTLADNFPTVNLEALASGTPVITFNTGGSPEAVSDDCGIVVEQGNMEDLFKAIVKVTSNRDIYSSQCCILRSKLFSNNQYNNYIHLFHEILEKTTK